MDTHANPSDSGAVTDPRLIPFLTEWRREMTQFVHDRGETVETRVLAHFEQRIDDVQRAMTKLVIEHSEIVATQLEQRVDEVQRAMTKLVIKHSDEKDAEFGSRFAELEARLPIFFASLMGSLVPVADRESREKLVAVSSMEPLTSPYKTQIESVYAQIEHTLRGLPSVIREDQNGYLKPLIGATCEARVVVDIGCGRGEWLDAVRDTGFEALGVEINPVYASLCRSKGHEILESDGLRALQELEAGTARLISLFHVVEHLEFDYLVSLLVEAHRVLAPGGRLIIETPNPEALQVSTLLFWLDPTHRRPVPCLLMTLILEALSFVVEETKVLHPSSSPLIEALSRVLPAETDDLLVSHLDYCVVVRK